MILACPKCSTKYDCQKENAGSEFGCSCGQQVRVPKAWVADLVQPESAFKKVFIFLSNIAWIMVGIWAVGWALKSHQTHSPHTNLAE